MVRSTVWKMPKWLSVSCNSRLPPPHRGERLHQVTKSCLVSCIRRDSPTSSTGAANFRSTWGCLFATSIRGRAMGSCAGQEPYPPQCWRNEVLIIPVAAVVTAGVLPSLTTSSGSPTSSTDCWTRCSMVEKFTHSVLTASRCVPLCAGTRSMSGGTGAFMTATSTSSSSSGWARLERTRRHPKSSVECRCGTA